MFAADVIYEESVIPLLVNTIYISFKCFSKFKIQQHYFRENEENEEDFRYIHKSFQSLLFYTPRALTRKQNIKIFGTLISYLDNVQEWNKKLFIWDEQCGSATEISDLDNIE